MIQLIDSATPGFFELGGVLKQKGLYQIRQDINSSIFTIYNLNDLASPVARGEASYFLDESMIPYEASTFFSIALGIISGPSAQDKIGHISWTDTQYPDSGTVFTLAANTNQLLPNNAGIKYDSEKPVVFPNMLETQEIGVTGIFTTVVKGSDNMGIDLMRYFKAVPSVANQWIDIWVDIEGVVGELYRQTFSFPKGSTVERGILYALPSAYTRGTWQANDGKIYVRSNAALNIYKINLNIDLDYYPET